MAGLGCAVLAAPMAGSSLNGVYNAYRMTGPRAECEQGRDMALTADLIHPATLSPYEVFGPSAAEIDLARRSDRRLRRRAPSGRARRR